MRNTLLVVINFIYSSDIIKLRGTPKDECYQAIMESSIVAELIALGMVKMHWYDLFVSNEKKVDELQVKVGSLETEVGSLKGEVDNLKSTNNELKKYLCSKDPDAEICKQ